MYLGALAAAGEIPDGPRLLSYAIGRLDQLSRRVRAHATAHSETRRQGAEHRAQARLSDRTLTGPLRLPRAAWPAWILLDGHAEPSFAPDGRLRFNERLVADGRVIDPARDGYRLIVRDAYLLASRPLPLGLDGRAVMAARDDGSAERAQRPRPLSVEAIEDRELAQLTGEPIAALQRVSAALRRSLLEDLRRRGAERAAQEIVAFRMGLGASR